MRSVAESGGRWRQKNVLGAAKRTEMQREKYKQTIPAEKRNTKVLTKGEKNDTTKTKRTQMIPNEVL